MAKLAEPDQAGVAEWLAERPQVIKDLFAKYPPNLLYWMDPPGQRVTIVSYAEDGTVRVAVSGQFNLVTFERQVFGVDPTNLTECDLPPSDEPVGALLIEEAEVTEFIDATRDSVLAGLHSKKED